MLFVVLMLAVLYFGRAAGREASEGAFRRTPLPKLRLQLVVWGVMVALVVQACIHVGRPTFFPRWLIGYGIGAHVAIPNQGMIDDWADESEAGPRDRQIYMIPLVTFLIVTFAITNPWLPSVIPTLFRGSTRIG